MNYVTVNLSTQSLKIYFASNPRNNEQTRNDICNNVGNLTYEKQSLEMKYFCCKDEWPSKSN